jgi:glycosyltransferase involved in cell wall biosynthesis
MNILFVEISLNPNGGGIERVTDSISRYLTLQGHKCYYLYSRTDYPQYKKDQKLKINYQDKQKKEFEKTLYQYIYNNKIDIIINQDLYSSNLIRFYIKYKNQLKFKLINCFHLSPDFYLYQQLHGIKYKIKYWIYQHIIRINLFVYERKKMYEICDKFVLLSNSFIPSFAQLYKIKDKNKLYSISNPLPFSQQNIDLMNKKKVVLIVSRFFEIQKNIKSALRIWESIERQGYDTWQLKIVGYGQDEAELKEYAQKLNLKHISFEGKRENVSDYYKEASIFMMTSNYEGFGMTLIEAQQHGCIPIAFDNFTVLHDIIQHEYNGYIIPTGNELLYTKTITRLFENQKERDNTAINAYHSSNKFSIMEIGRKWDNLISQL